MSSTAGAGMFSLWLNGRWMSTFPCARLTRYCPASIGLSLTDTLDDLINEGRIEPQLAMKILSTFDRVVTEVLADKVQVKLSFKVRLVPVQFSVWRQSG